eukprot:2173-Rhodomonas_salina.1
MQVCKSTIPWVLDVYWFSPHSTQSVSAKRGRIGLGVVASAVCGVCVGAGVDGQGQAAQHGRQDGPPHPPPPGTRPDLTRKTKPTQTHPLPFSVSKKRGDVRFLPLRVGVGRARGLRGAALTERM